MAKKDTSLKFNPSVGIGKSILEDNAFSRCIDNDTYKGIARIGTKTLEAVDSDTDWASEVWTLGGTAQVVLTGGAVTGWFNGFPVTFSSTGTLPDGLSADTVYYVRMTTGSPGYYFVYDTYAKTATEAGYMVLYTADAGSGTLSINPVEIEDIKQFLDNYFVDSNGNFGKIDFSIVEPKFELISTGSTNGKGMTEYGDYIYLFRGAGIDRYNTSTGAITDDWQTDSILGGLVNKDNILYMYYSNKIASYDGTTYNDAAYTLPTEAGVTCLSEVGLYLIIGTENNKIYLWDTIKINKAETVINLPERPVGIISVNNLAYVRLGNADMYVTDGFSMRLFREFPKFILDDPDGLTSTVSSKQNSNFVKENDIYFGFDQSSSPRDSSGIYKLSLESEDLRLSHILSNDKDSNIIYAISEDYVSFKDSDGNYGIDIFNSNFKYETGAIVYSKMHTTGIELSPTTYSTVNVSLIKPLTANQSVTVSYRTTINGSWSLIGTVDTVGDDEFFLPLTIPETTKIQLKYELKTGSSDTDRRTTPDLKGIILYE